MVVKARFLHLQLMVFLGNDMGDSISKIQSNAEEKKTAVSVVLSDTGYASLVFPFDKNADYPKKISGREMQTYHQWMEVTRPFKFTRTANHFDPSWIQ